MKSQQNQRSKFISGRAVWQSFLFNTMTVSPVVSPVQPGRWMNLLNGSKPSNYTLPSNSSWSQMRKVDELPVISVDPPKKPEKFGILREGPSFQSRNLCLQLVLLHGLQHRRTVAIGHDIVFRAIRVHNKGPFLGHRLVLWGEGVEVSWIPTGTLTQPDNS